MKNVFCITLFLFCIVVSAQSPTQNYVKVTTYLAPSTGEITENDTIVKVMYYDGLGRPKQIVDVRAGGGGEDIVTPVRYDQFGRQTREYLPYATATQNGNILPDPMTELEAFYGIPKYGNTTNPYSEKILEASPLNRVMEQGAPGNPWAANPLSDTDHTIKFEYSANTTDEVRLYRVTTIANSYGVHLSTYVPTLENPGFYNPGTLYKTITKDENWQPGDSLLHTTEEFKDLRGRVVLKRTYANLPEEPQAAHDTYYVYDKFSNLSYVIPPKVDASDGVSDEELSELCYQYVYDHRNRLVEKKLPGKAWESIVYNKLDHPVFTRDKHLKDQGKWLFTKYDKFGRIVYTGLYDSTDSREDLQTTLENHSPLYETKADMPTLIDGTEVYYTNIAFPDTGLELLTIQYYDTYNFDLDGATAEMSYNVVPTIETRSLSTGSKTRVLETDKWITSVVYYDKKARPVYTYTKNNFLNTTDKIKSKVDFVGKVLETNTVHTKDGLADITTIEKFSYDRMGRLLKHTHQLAGQPEETLAENTYDELGKLTQKKVGNTPASPLQTVDYSYNIRGWLTKINDVDNMGNDLFSFDIRYNDPTAGGTALYNGNISQTHWRTNNTDSSLKHYSYSYDALNRITGAIHNTGNYNLNAISYDKNGNITFLERKGHVNSAATSFGVMDGLTYTYDSGNKLIRVNDQEHEDFGFKDVWTNGVEYTYDANGNMLSDTNKGITDIIYNYMNLPVQITINGENIFYIYDASGGKQQKVADGTTTAYAGRYIYENSSLKFISHPEGYIEPDGAGGYDYVYQYKDHLGNTRLSYTDTNDDGIVDNSEISSEKNYYPFGLTHQGYNNQIQGTYHPYGFGGKEEQSESELEWLDFSARNYDAALGRWMNIDLLADASGQIHNSPYAYAMNNPVFYTDPDGNCPPGIDCSGILAFVLGNHQGHKNFVNNAIDGVTKGIPAAVSKSFAANNAILSGDSRGFSAYADMGSDIAKGVVSPITQTVEGVEHLANGNYYQAGADFAEVADGAATALLTEGAGRALSTTSKITTKIDNAVGAMDGKRLGHTFTKHGSQNTHQLVKQAEGSGSPQGQWLNNKAAENIIADNLDNLKNGAINVEIPTGVGRVINPDGSFTSATHARLVPSGSGVKTAYPGTLETLPNN